MHGRPDPKHLIDTLAEQNIGNGFILQPQSGGATIIPQTNPERLLMLTGPSSAGQTTSIVLTASRIVGPNNPYPGFPGPITGVIEFGNGGQFTRVEVDVPIGPFAGSILQAAVATEPQDGGIIITVPTGVLRVYARYDNNLIQSPINIGSTSIAQFQSTLLHPIPFIGPGGPKSIGGPFPVPAEPVQVKAMAAYFSRHTSKVYRTQYLYVGDCTTGFPYTIPISGYFVCIPPFARSLRVLRFPSVAMTVNLYDNTNPIQPLEDAIPVPAGASPIIPLSGTETIVRIATPSPLTNLIGLLALCYEIGI